MGFRDQFSYIVKLTQNVIPKLIETTSELSTKIRDELKRIK